MTVGRDLNESSGVGLAAKDSMPIERSLDTPVFGRNRCSRWPLKIPLLTQNLYRKRVGMWNFASSLAPFSSPGAGLMRSNLPVVRGREAAG